MSPYVVDASVAAKWFALEEYSDLARRVRDPDNELHAPDFYLFEMANVVCKWVRRDEIDEEYGNTIRAALDELPVEIHPSLPLLDSACEIANRTGRSVYDCLYVALAVLLDAQVVTADRRLYDGLADGPYSRYVVWIEDIDKGS